LNSYCIHASDQHQEVPALVRAEELEDLDNGIPEAAACPLTRLSQQHLELGKCLLDGIKVGAVGRQVVMAGI